ncbi:MAG: hypothetical protein JJ920_19390 [Roseitalea sp.]|jgi:hypothetical protein|nr:hypothetical protein [Roseitalea sp.]MBO6722882.1 hypothetical protein [Roseitalea sp.]MBO6745084.1 hypothetical protein [Roseitalea sp.]
MADTFAFMTSLPPRTRHGGEASNDKQRSERANVFVDVDSLLDEAANSLERSANVLDELAADQAVWLAHSQALMARIERENAVNAEALEHWIGDVPLHG